MSALGAVGRWLRRPVPRWMQRYSGDVFRHWLPLVLTVATEIGLVLALSGKTTAPAWVWWTPLVVGTHIAAAAAYRDKREERRSIFTSTGTRPRPLPRHQGRAGITKRISPDSLRRYLITAASSPACPSGIFRRQPAALIVGPPCDTTEAGAPSIATPPTSCRRSPLSRRDRLGRYRVAISPVPSAISGTVQEAPKRVLWESPPKPFDAARTKYRGARPVHMGPRDGNAFRCCRLGLEDGKHVC